MFDVFDCNLDNQGLIIRSYGISPQTVPIAPLSPRHPDLPDDPKLEQPLGDEDDHSCLADPGHVADLPPIDLQTEDLHQPAPKVRDRTPKRSHSKSPPKGQTSPVPNLQPEGASATATSVKARQVRENSIHSRSSASESRPTPSKKPKPNHNLTSSRNYSASSFSGDSDSSNGRPRKNPRFYHYPGTTTGRSTMVSELRQNSRLSRPRSISPSPPQRRPHHRHRSRYSRPANRRPSPSNISPLRNRTRSRGRPIQNRFYRQPSPIFNRRHISPLLTERGKGRPKRDPSPEQILGLPNQNRGSTSRLRPRSKSQADGSRNRYYDHPPYEERRSNHHKVHYSQEY